MRKRMIRMAVLGCAFALLLTHISAAAAPRTEQATEADAGETAPDTGEDVDTADTEDSMAESDEPRETMEPGDSESDEGRETAEAGDDDENDGPEVTSDTEGSAVDIGGQERRTAEQLRTEKGSSVMAAMDGADSGGDLDVDLEDDDMEYDEDEEEEKHSYTAPEDSRHANVSFSFVQASASAYFSKLTYPLTLSLKEVDTGDRVTLTVKSEGQILEVEKGDYAVTSIKDSGRIPLSVAGDTLHIYDNTEYSVRFAANNALKMFTDFLADNIFLVCFFAFAALFYKEVIIPRFASDIRRK